MPPTGSASRGIRPGRAVALLALLVGSSFLPLLASADAPASPTPPDSGSGNAPQPSPFLCFVRTSDGRGDFPSKEAENLDPTATQAPPTPDPANPNPPPPPPRPSGKECPGGTPDAPDFFEGETIRMRLYNIPAGVFPSVRVVCVTNCHEIVASYYAQMRQDSNLLEFPKDFTQNGPHGEAGGNPVADRAPRYNGTWKATLLLGDQPVERPFRVWLLDSFLGTNATVMPGESHAIRAYGFEDAAIVRLVVEHRLPDTGAYVPVLDKVDGPKLDGAHFFEWNLPKSEATNISLCGNAHMKYDCYRVRVIGSSTTKANETEYFPVSPADVRPTFYVGQNAHPAQDPQLPRVPEVLERTAQATVALNFNYPGGRVHQGATFTPADLSNPPAGEERIVHVHVVRTNATAPALGPVTVDDVPLRYVPDHFRWEATWTVPRDLAIDPSAVFELKLPETRDLYGNRIPPMSLGNYTVTFAHLQPVAAASFNHLERAQEGRVALSILYHNGTPVSDRDNATPLTGCFVKDLGNDALAACTGLAVQAANGAVGEVTNGSYENGLWNFRVTYPRDFMDLAQYRFVLLGGETVQDKWNNTINATTLAPFDVLAASPHVKLSTVMRGRSTDTVERGQHGSEAIGVTATITYPDGTPFNHTVRYDPKSDAAHRINVTLTKRGEDDAIQSVSTLWLTEVDSETGRWFAPLDVNLDDPLGRWSFDLFVNDTVTPVPNLNRTSFDRHVIAAPLKFEPLTVSNTIPSTNTVLTFNFRVHNPDGSTIEPDAIRRTLAAQVYRFDVKEHSTIGDAISALLQPQYDATYQWWSISYVVPGYLFNGSYAFVVTGRDTAGNILPQDAWSRAFAPQSLVRTRQVVTQPPLEVQRGDAATVVFAAQDGDTGIDGAGSPVLRVERFDPDAGRWSVVAGGADVFQHDPAIRDHFGVFGVETTTAIGTYRFVLVGREGAPGYAIITNASANFTVLPTDVPRGLVSLPQQEVTKGDLVNYRIERREGDRVSDVQLLLNGRETTLPRPSLVAEGDHINVSWRVPFEAPIGNYTIRVVGRDQFGNTIEIDSPAIEATAAVLSGKIIGNPARVVARGTPATLLFGITYPSGVFYNDPTVPTVYVYNASGLVTEAAVQRNGLTFQASWAPVELAESVPYWFEVQGAGVGGNSFPNLKSSTFEPAPGSFVRAATAEVPVNNERFGGVPWSIPISPNDVSVAFEVGYFGPGNDIGGIVSDSTPTLTRNPLPAARSNETSQYLVRFTTDQQTPVGAYRMYMTGTDRLGNQISATSRTFFLKTTPILVSFTDAVGATFGAGKTTVLNFTAKYKSGPNLDADHGRPSVGVLVNGASTTERPQIDYVNGVWRITWTAPDTLLPGDYTFVVGGADASGNQISTSRTPPFTVAEGSTANALAKVVPGPEPILAIVAVAALALALRSRRVN